MNGINYISIIDTISQLIYFFIEDGNYYKIFFGGVDYFPFYNLLSTFIDHTFWDQTIIMDFIGTHGSFVIILFLYTLLVAYIFRGICKILKLKRFSFGGNEKYFHFFFIVLPIVNVLYGMLLGFSNLKISKQIKYIFGGIVFWTGILFLRQHSGANGYEGLISPFYFSPIILLVLFLWKPLQNWKQICKYTIIIGIFLLLMIQPFFFRFFIDERNPMESKMCYPRTTALSQSDYVVVGSQCFKIFEPFGLYPWMHDFGLTYYESYIWNFEQKLEELERQKEKNINNQEKVIFLDKEIRYYNESLLAKRLNHFYQAIKRYKKGTGTDFDISKWDMIQQEYEKFILKYGKTFKNEEFYQKVKAEIKDFDNIK